MDTSKRHSPFSEIQLDTSSPFAAARAQMIHDQLEKEASDQALRKLKRASMNGSASVTSGDLGMNVQDPSVKDLIQRDKRSLEHTVDHDDGEDYVLAVFIVRFDTNQGNIVEWSHPPGLDLTGLEFSALPSGLHLVQKDVITFMKNTYYGISVFENQIVKGEDAIKERGARMCAAGLLSDKFNRLFRHVEFLREAVGYQSAEKEIAQMLLKGYWDQQQRMYEQAKKDHDANIMHEQGIHGRHESLMAFRQGPLRIPRSKRLIVRRCFHCSSC